MTGVVPKKAADVETNPGPITTHKQVWIFDIYHKQIHGRKQISIRCNRIEYWMHLRCAGIRQAQYTPIPPYPGPSPLPLHQRRSESNTCTSYLPTPLTLVCGGSSIIQLLVHQPAYLSVWPAAPSIRRGLSTNPEVTMWCVCGCS